MKKLYLLIVLLTTVPGAGEVIIQKKAGAIYRSQPLLHSVHDMKTDLWWEDTSMPGTQLLTWREAISYCEALELDFFDDWRLPNIFELASITVSLKNWGDSQKTYWSSTTYPGRRMSAMIYLYDPLVSYRHRYILDKGEKAYVRCVR